MELTLEVAAHLLNAAPCEEVGDGQHQAAVQKNEGQHEGGQLSNSKKHRQKGGVKNQHKSRSHLKDVDSPSIVARTRSLSPSSVKLPSATAKV